jgi:tetratricopeptide (TPR) repeat protein
MRLLPATPLEMLLEPVQEYAVLFVVVFTFASAVAALLGLQHFIEGRSRTTRKRRKSSSPVPAKLTAHSLADNLPEGNTPEVAQALNNLGNIYYQNRQLDKAEHAYIEALAIYDLLSKKAPQTWAPLRARLLEHLGTTYRDRQQYAEAQEAFADALKLYRSLEKQQPNVHLLYIWSTLKNLDFVCTQLPVSNYRRNHVRRELADAEQRLR